MINSITEPIVAKNGNTHETKCFRKYHLEIGELLDRLTILQLKEVKVKEYQLYARQNENPAKKLLLPAAPWPRVI